ncbi:hypothetical protein LZ30DRAFT_322060 [Colletotrichum cereale]|nr:hypothetical protein LZ30DRAFT_322060 [Colletotrichum cereale]
MAVVMPLTCTHIHGPGWIGFENPNRDPPPSHTAHAHTTTFTSWPQQSASHPYSPNPLAIIGGPKLPLFPNVPMPLRSTTQYYAVLRGTTQYQFSSSPVNRPHVPHPRPPPMSTHTRVAAARRGHGIVPLEQASNKHEQSTTADRRHRIASVGSSGRMRRFQCR